MATVNPGRAKCVKLRNVGTTPILSFEMLGSRSRWYSQERNFMGRPGWIWRIDSNLPTMSTSRITVHYQCIPGAEESNTAVLR